MIRLPLRPALAFAASIAAASALADTPPVQIQADRAEAVSVADLDAVKGLYRFEDGRVLIVTRTGRRVSAEFGRAPVRELVAVSPTRYESRDGTMKLDFRAHANGIVSAVTMQLVEGRRVAVLQSPAPAPSN